MDIKELRQQQTDRTWRTMVYEAKGNKCAVCGTTGDMEIHHVLPVSMGGTNELDNILILCQKHHKHIHLKIHKTYIDRGINKVIRFENALPALDRYFNQEIGWNECLDILGYSRKNHSIATELKTEYKRRFNVPEDFYNNIDLKASQPNKRRRTKSA